MFQLQFSLSTETSGAPVKCQCDGLKTLTRQNLAPQKVEDHILRVKYLPLACTHVLGTWFTSAVKHTICRSTPWPGKANCCWFVWRLFSGRYHCWYSMHLHRRLSFAALVARFAWAKSFTISKECDLDKRKKQVLVWVVQKSRGAILSQAQVVKDHHSSTEMSWKRRQWNMLFCWWFQGAVIYKSSRLSLWRPQRWGDGAHGKEGKEKVAELNG